jgi:putative aldouronate transport system substrate-binding protein
MAIDDNGKVINYATDTRMKSAVKALASMYKENLIAKESFTENALQYTERVNNVTDTPYIGVFTAYWAANDEYVPMSLFQSVEGTEPVIRCQPLGVTRNRMVLFSECEHPDKVLQVMDWIAQEKNAMYNDFGKEGEGWDYDEATDTYTVHKVEGGEAITPTNSWPGLLDDRFKGRVEYDEDHAWAKRLTAIELYGDNIMDVNHIIPPMYMSSNSIKKADDYKVNIFSKYVAPLMRKWILGEADITADWDEYVSQLNALGLKDYIAIYQEAYDNISK